jgi:hypothetical protein
MAAADGGKIEEPEVERRFGVRSDCSSYRKTRQRCSGRSKLARGREHRFRIEVAFKIGNQQYALEHTVIEPFEGYLEMEAQAKQLFDPIKDALNGNLGSTAFFELRIPVNAFKGHAKKRVNIQRALIDWVKATAPTLPKPPHCTAARFS